MTGGDGPVPRTARLLPPPPAVVALTGGGGKTTLLYTLGGYLHRQGRRVLLSTTTRVYPPGADEAVLWVGREPPSPQCRGGVPRLWGAGIDAAGKVVGVDPALFRAAAGAYDYLLVEADGSRGLPLKFWRPDEPVLPGGVTDVLCLASTHALGRPVADVLHRHAAAAELIALPRRVDAALWAALRLYQRDYLRRLLPDGARLLLLERGPRRLMPRLPRPYPAWWWSEADCVSLPPAPGAAAVVLAAGAGRRFGGGKLLAPLGGRPVLGRVLALINSLPLYPRLAVAGAEAGVMDVAQGYGFAVVDHPGWAAGMGSSLARGVAALVGAEAEAEKATAGVFVFLGDMPMLRRRTLLALLNAVRRQKPRVAYPVYRGRRGHPVYFSRECFPDLLSLQGEDGGRKVLARYPDHLAVPVDDPGVAADVDRVEDLALMSRLRGEREDD